MQTAVNLCPNSHQCLDLPPFYSNENSLLIKNSLIGKLSLTDPCCFWTATNVLPPRSSTLQIKFDDGESALPTAETSFKSITLPTRHTSYDDFQRNMDIALRYGSMGIDLS